ncbi:hypothetical protein GCM10011507_24350 [Edaphobacter acidisoli]|uniref:Uncharacterized protein n=1 Tax=Edaphobacter acidisoli TaxID=2040573 RepID=A0A916RV14_9BACT|nr:hypothetical protein [Edaphobacter acidisoli]GGA71861.1 hypothetical protein GCM10011507_24350 [Edaphobacter acidisoli]
MNDEFEQQLKKDLERVAAPDGFADRVMRRVQTGESARLHIMPRRMLHVWQAVAAVALIGVLLGSGLAVRQRQERQRAEVLQRQFDLAMQITQRTLSGVGQRISEAGVKQDGEEQ